MSIKGKLLALGAAQLLGLLAGIIVVTSLVNTTNRKIDVLQNRYMVQIELARRLQFDVVQIQQFLTDYSATRGRDELCDGLEDAEKFLKDFEETSSKFVSLLENYNDHSDLRALQEIVQKAKLYYEHGRKMAGLYAKEGTEAGNKYMHEFDKAAEALNEQLEPFAEDQKTQLSASLVGIRQANRKVLILVVAGGLILCAGIAVVTVWIGRSIVSNVLRSVVTMHANVVMTTSVARQINQASGSLADGANSQAASVEETSASLEEIATSTKHNSDEARRANGLAKDTRSVAERGVADMEEMNRAMDMITVSSKEISAIIKTIDEIAFQTNILALNAAVEAARAGSAGAGFAIVAEEVRKLAQRCAESARETSSKIEGAISNTARGVEISKKVSGNLNEIVTKARELDTLASQLAEASGEQAVGIDQINHAVSQIEKVTQGTAVSASDNATASKSLMDQTVVLKDAIEKLMQFLGEQMKGGFAPARKGTSVIRWDQASMTTSVPTIDEQHQKLIELINAVHATVQKGRGGDELMRQLHFLGEYAQEHFSHEESVMDSHRCPIAGKNKEAHARFLGDYQNLVQQAHANGPTPELALAVKKLLGDWLNSHICKVDTNLRGCHPGKDKVKGAAAGARLAS